MIIGGYTALTLAAVFRPQWLLDTTYRTVP